MPTLMDTEILKIYARKDLFEDDLSSLQCALLGNLTLAGRETSISLHHGGPIKASHKTLNTIVL